MSTSLKLVKQFPSVIPVAAMMAFAFALTLLFQFHAASADAGSANVQDLPYYRGDWRCDHDYMEGDDLMKQIGADSVLLRRYKNSKTGQEVELYLVYRRYGRREFNHNPDQCFPAGGYRLLERNTTTFPYAGGEHQAVHMRFDGSQVENPDTTLGQPSATVCYFFASGARTEHVFLKQQMQMALERFVPNKNGWTLVRLNAPKLTTDEAALDAQKQFMRDFGPAIEDVITTDRAHDGS